VIEIEKGMKKMPDTYKCGEELVPDGGQCTCKKCGGEHYYNKKSKCNYSICSSCGKARFPAGPCKCTRDYMNHDYE